MKAKYALISSFLPENKDNNLLYFLNYFYYIFKIVYYTLIKNKTRLNKYKLKYLDIKEAGPHKIIGHRALLLSLFRGFKDLKIPYTYNKITKDTENVILIWVDENEMKIIDKLKADGKIKKVVTVPTACKYDYEYWMFQLAREKSVDCCLVASEWFKEYYKTKLEPEFYNKVIPWASGVKLVKNKNSGPTMSCICYYKKLPVNSSLNELLDKFGIKYYNLEYAKHNFIDWTELLKQVDFVIFCQDYVETQGLAIAEAWAYNKPTFIKLNTNEYGGKTSPYLTDKQGLFYNDIEELQKILSSYKENPKDFLSKFSPAEYIEQNMSDAVSVKKLIEIFDNKVNDCKIKI